MASVGSFEAKILLPQLFERVDHCEKFTITEHSKPIAIYQPTQDADQPMVYHHRTR